MTQNTTRYITIPVGGRPKRELDLQQVSIYRRSHTQQETALFFNVSLSTMQRFLRSNNIH